MQIDRVMDCFAEHYCLQNPNIFEERDTCFILSFSIIMLNTALHNPNAKMKITSEQFIKQNKGINSGRDLPPDMLEAIFRNIKEEPFKIPDETYDDLMYTFFSPEREGWLMKQVGWKNEWCHFSSLFYFITVINYEIHFRAEVGRAGSDVGLSSLTAAFIISNTRRRQHRRASSLWRTSQSDLWMTRTGSSGPSRSITKPVISWKDVRLTVPGQSSKEITITTGQSPLSPLKHLFTCLCCRMSAASEEDRDLWMNCIRDSIENNPFSKVIAEKKASMRQKSIQMQKFPEKNFHAAQEWLNFSH